MRTFLSMMLFSLVIGLCGTAAAEQGVKVGQLKVVMYSGSVEYKSAESLLDLKKELEGKYGALCSLHVADEKGSTLKGIEDLASCDVAVVFTRRLKLDEGQVERLKAYVKAGKPVVGIRTASHAFQTWLEFDPQVIGGNYKGHYGKDEPAEVKLVAKDHPVLAGVTAFKTTGKLYKNPEIAKDVTLLLTATTPTHSEPVAWTRTAADGGGRVFYTSLGTPEDFRIEGFRRMLVNAVYWSAKQEVPAPKGS